jgi:hypothetical protein
VGESSDGVGGARKLALSPEEIAKVKKEWEDQQARKKEREATKEKENDKDKDKEEKTKSDKDKEEGKDSDEKSTNTASTTPPPPPTPTHRRFTLHRDMFALRLSEHRKRRQAAQAKSLAPKLPSAPQGGFA